VSSSFNLTGITMINSTVSFLSQTVLGSNSSGLVLGTSGLSSGYFLGTSSPVGVFSNAGTGGSVFLSTLGMVTGSVFTAPAGASAAISVGLSSLPIFTYIGTATSSLTTTAFPSAFIAGVLQTGTLPGSSFALTTNGTSLTLWTGGCVQPWFALVGE
jgi:hypothetical protein